MSTSDLLTYYGLLGIIIFIYLFYRCSASYYLTENEIKNLEEIKAKFPKSRTAAEGNILYTYGLISYSESREMLPKTATDSSILSSTRKLIKKFKIKG